MNKEDIYDQIGVIIWVLIVLGIPIVLSLIFYH
jgi:hypothetical protein